MAETETAATSPAKLTFDIEGMHCASCVARVESALRQSPEVRDARVNLATHQATITLRGDTTPTERLVQAVAQAGYRATLHAADEPLRLDADQQEAQRWRARFVLALLGLVLSLLVMWAPGLPHSVAGWLALAVATLVQLLVGWPFYQGAWNRLRHGSANMDTLVAIGTSTGYLAGVADVIGGHHGMTLHDAVMILTFLTLGKWLECRAKGRASRAIQQLVELSPKETVVLRNLQTQTVPLAEVRVGETIIVRPGERVPLDAVVVTGSSQLDEAWLTGEPLPVPKRAGDTIFAGTINGTGSLNAKVTRLVSSTGLAQIVELVRKAQESRAQVQKLADVVVAWFVPVVLGIAVATFAIWTWAGASSTGISCTIAVLLVACPCALGLATPTAILVASGRGAELGILIKDAAALEMADRISLALLDKTGTITEGKPSLAEIRTLVDIPEYSPRKVLELAASIAVHSSHPLSRAIVAHRSATACIVTDGLANDVAVPARSEELAGEVRQTPGGGLSGMLGNRRVVLGNETFLRDEGMTIPPAATEHEASLRAQGLATCLLGIDSSAVAVLGFADRPRAESRAGVAGLQQQGIRPVMLSGDKSHVAQAIAEQVGIGEFRGDLRPDEKHAIVESYQREGRAVAFIGDGINDAAALAAADLGIAIGAGADVAIEAADIVLMRADLRDAAKAIALARRTLRTIRQNLGWAFVYNVALLPLAAGVLIPVWGLGLPPAFAAAAMALSSVSVVSNSLRLRRFR